MDPDTLAALAAYVRSQAVSSARIVGLHASWYAVECSAGDGARWHVVTDKHASAYGWHETLPGALRDLAHAYRLKAQRAELRLYTALEDHDDTEADAQRLWHHDYLTRADKAEQRAREADRWLAA